MCQGNTKLSKSLSAKFVVVENELRCKFSLFVAIFPEIEIEIVMKIKSRKYY